MKALLAAGLLLSGAAAAPAGCNADNCLRALRATQTPGRLADAQSFCAAYTATGATATPTVPAYATGACAGNRLGPLEARLSSACACIGTPSTSVPTSPPTQEPCAVASSAWASFVAASPSAVPTIAAEIAHACLASVPFDKKAALELVDAIVPYLEWQSDTAYKADPPPTYYPPAYDLWAELAAVRAKVASGGYSSETEFQHELYTRVFAPGHDGHMIFYPDLLTTVFDYGRGVILVSISDDATGGTPEIKFLSDVEADPETASAVILIDGEPAEQVIQKVGDGAVGSQDVDAVYNNMFYSKGLYGSTGGVGNWARGGRIRFTYPGATTTYTFANGTSVTVTNQAYVRAPLTGITDGAAMFQRFCAGALSPDGVPYKANTTSSGDKPYAVAGYPAPLKSTSDGQASCYYLEGAGFEDVMVLALLSFEPSVPAEFQYVIHDCLTQAAQAGRRKVVLDVSANGGGYILLGYDLFRQLYPAVVQDGISRWREHSGFLALAQIASKLAETFDPTTSGDIDLINLWESQFNYKYDLDVDNKPFADYAAKFAPHAYQHTNYTANMRWNLDDALTTTNSTTGLGTPVSGYGPLANISAPPIDDLVLLYDGYCASTCTLASEMLRLQGGVRSIAMGGRPSVAGQPIQGVGGIKGSQIYDFSDILYYVQEAQGLLANGTVTLPNQDAVVAALAQYSDLPVRRSSAAAVNVRDQILRPNVEDGLPAQYVYEPADCRLYYTADMVGDVTATWKAAAQAAFSGGACAAGSAVMKTGQPAMAKRDSASTAKLGSIYKAEADKGFRPQDLPEAERVRFMAEYNQKKIV